ncbi:unnamed protein product [Sphagnum balticum]
MENIIVHAQHLSDEYCLINAHFIDEHRIVFWNLIWYFKRVGVDASYLIDILLNSRVSMLRNELITATAATTTVATTASAFKFSTSFPNKIKKPYHQHPHVKVKCMWDNLKLHNTIKTHEVPLYISWLNSDVFDTEYRKAYKKLLSADQSHEPIRVSDRPPSNAAVWVHI